MFGLTRWLKRRHRDNKRYAVIIAVSWAIVQRELGAKKSPRGVCLNF